MTLGEYIASLNTDERRTLFRDLVCSLFGHRWRSLGLKAEYDVKVCTRCDLPEWTDAARR